MEAKTEHATEVVYKTKLPYFPFTQKSYFLSPRLYSTILINEKVTNNLTQFSSYSHTVFLFNIKEIISTNERSKKGRRHQKKLI